MVLNKNNKSKEVSMMYQVKYRLKDRTMLNSSGNRVYNPNHNIEVLSGVWCNKKKKTIPLGTLSSSDFYKLTGIITIPATDPRGEIKESVSKERFVALRSFLKTSKDQ